jgi:hypothetical protein
MLQNTVKREITIGVLVGGVCISLIMWFLVYTEEKAQAFDRYSTTPGIRTISQ